MRKGFIFDAALCVNCNACSAACILDNGLQPGTRNIYTWNCDALPLFRVITLSLACSHCERPACAEGCPATAYTVDDSGVVIHHADRCMGCGYCTWRCPYDAPKINDAKGYIEKCHLCHERTAEGIGPACVTACPTGALRFTEQESFGSVDVSWFPDTGIGPSLTLRNADYYAGPEIIPSEVGAVNEDLDQNPDQYHGQNPNQNQFQNPDLYHGRDNDSNQSPTRLPEPDRMRKEWSLVLFSLLVISASALMIIQALTGALVSGALPLLLLAVALAVSVAHLGVPGKAWRAPLNIFSSPLSREIAMVGLLTLTALLSWLKPGLPAPLTGGLLALLTLISIDLVFFAADRRVSLRLHSGQAFFSAIYAVSWFTEPRMIFMIFSMLAAISVVIRYGSTERDPVVSKLYYFRAMALPLVFLLLYPGTPFTETIAMIMFFAGIVADRILFYYDFNPVNIRDTIREHFRTEYEKERDKQRQDSGLP